MSDEGPSGRRLDWERMAFSDLTRLRRANERIADALERLVYLLDRDWFGDRKVEEEELSAE